MKELSIHQEKVGSMRQNSFVTWATRLFGVVVAGCWVTVWSAVVEVTNPGFESQVLADGGWVNRAIDGWVVTAGTDGGVENPTDDMFSGTTGNGPGMPEGRNCAWLNTTGSISQQLAAAVRPNTRYTLTVAVGDRKATAVGLFSVELYAGTRLLGSVSPQCVDDAWVSAVVRYQSEPFDPSVGQPLRIVFSKPGWSFGEQVCFDNVRLTSEDLQPLVPFGYWKFEELTGGVAGDTMLSHNGALSAAGARFQAGGISGRCLNLDAAENGYVVVTDLGGFANSNFTVSAWARLDAGAARDGMVLLGVGAEGGTNGFALTLHQTGDTSTPFAVTFQVNGGTGSGDVVSEPFPDDGQWHQVVAVHSLSNQVAVYVDGASRLGLGDVPPIRRTDAPLVLGGMLSTSPNGLPVGRFTGLLDDVQIYGRALSARQVGQLYRNPGCGLNEVEGEIWSEPGATEFVVTMDVKLMSTLAGAAIRYTVDGSAPSATSPLYTSPLMVTSTTDLRAALFRDQVQVSEVFGAVYTRVPTITFAPAVGLFTNSVQVRLVNGLPFGSMYYTVDGSEPSTHSAVYGSPVTLTTATTIKARVFASGVGVSEVCRSTYLRVYALDDGISADWRLRYFGAGYLTDPRVSAAADPDGDGWSNLVEFQNGSDPTDKSSQPAIVSGIRAVPLVSWNTIPGLTYRVLRKASVDATNWVVVLPPSQATSTNTEFVDRGAPATAIYLIERVP